MTIGAIKTNDLQYQPIQQGRQSEDVVKKELQNELASARKQLKEIDSGQEKGVMLESDAKEKRQQEIRKQISELNRELRQREMELQKERKQENRAELEKQEQKTLQTENKATGNTETESEPVEEEKQTVKETQQQMSSGYVEAFVYVDGAFRQMETQQQVVSSLSRQAAVLESEIGQDRGRIDVEKKEAQLEEMQGRVTNAASLKLQVLGNFHTKIQNAEEAEQMDLPGKRSGKDSDIDVFPQFVQRDEDGNIPNWKNFFQDHNHRKQLFAGVQLEMFV